MGTKGHRMSLAASLGLGPATLALLIFGVMLVLMALRAPIAVSMGLAGALGYAAQAG